MLAFVHFGTIHIQTKNAHFCALSYDPYMKLYIHEFLRNVLFPWNMDGHPDSSSWIESGFLPDSFLGLYSDGGNHTRVFVVSYAHGRILSVPSRSVIILRVRAVLLGHSMITLSEINGLRLWL
jgi:hypothetical protein